MQPGTLRGRFTALSLVLFVGFLLYEFVFRDFYFTPADRQRQLVHNNGMQRGFSVALVWPPHTDKSLIEGVTLAKEELDAAGGPLAGKIRLRTFVETADKGETARRVAQYEDVLCVIGHEVVGTSIPSSITYEEHGIVFISPKITDQRLTHHDFKYTLRLTPDDAEVAEALASYAVTRGFKRVGVLHGRILRHQMVADRFVTSAKHHGIDVPFQRSYFHDPDGRTQDLRPFIAEIRRAKFDALMLADDLPWGGKLLKDLKLMGVDVPVLASDKLDSMEVWDIAGTDANNLYVASAVNPDATDVSYAAFRQRFQARFGAPPGYGASQGYEAFRLFTNAILKANSADPIVVTTTIKMNQWEGIFGPFSFDLNGDVKGRDISIKKMDNGKFRLMSVEEQDIEKER
jgi:branched-chain amino acid transport system substrate-binding protein